jgi:hypothetical protein
MAVSVSIQETTIVPTDDGYRVQLYVSDKPPVDEASADLVLTLRARIDRTGSVKLPAIQLQALNRFAEVLTPLMKGLYLEQEERR